MQDAMPCWPSLVSLFARRTQPWLLLMPLQTPLPDPPPLPSRLCNPGRGMQLRVSICAEAATATASAIAQQAQQQQQWEQQLLTCFASSSISPQTQAAHLPGPAHQGSWAAPARRSRCGPAG